MADYYFDFDGGLDANGGGIGAPKKNLSHAATLALSGNRLFLKAGVRWPVTTGEGWTLTGKLAAAGCRIDAYGDLEADQKPLIDALHYEAPGVDDAGWTHIGGGQWTKDFDARIDRAWAGTTVASVLASGSMGRCFGYVSSAAAVTSETKWHMLTASPFTVTMYTGSTSIAPPTFFDGLAFAGNGKASTAGVILRRCQNVLVSNLRVAGGVSQFINEVSNTTNDALNIQFIDCEGFAWSRAGNAFRTTNISAGMKLHGTRFVRPIARSKTDAYENDGDTSRWGSHNAFGFNGHYTDTHVVDPVIDGACGHSMFQSQSDGTTTRFLGQGLRVYRTRPDMGILYCQGDVKEYGHPFDIDGEGWLIEGIVVDKPCNASQLAGRGVMRGCDFGVFQPCVAQPWSLGSSTGQVGNSYLNLQNWDSPDYRSVFDISIVGNLFRGPYGYVLAVNYDVSALPNGTTAADALKFMHNTVLDLGTPAESRSALILAFCPNTFAAVPTQVWKNNLFVTAMASLYRVETSNNVMTNYAVNSAPGGQCEGNVLVASLAAAGINAEGEPTSSAAAVYRAGVHTGARRDFNGRQFWNPPSVGCREFTAARAQRA